MTKVLLCRCAYTELAPGHVCDAMLAELSNAGVDVCVIPDLCELAARRDPSLREFVAGASVTVLACYPRTVKWLFDAAGLKDAASNLGVINIRTTHPEAIRATVQSSGTGGSVTEVGVKGDWVPWFPVIDYSRCKSCRQCMEFCLFGVYELSDDGRVVVAHPRNCKNNCPACARICPEVAIIFPKLKESPLNGDEIDDENLEKARVQIDVDKILGSDVYSTLQERKRKRKKRLLKQCDIEQAEAERAACAACDVPCENTPKK